MPSKEKLTRVINRYNHYHSPEATARLLSTSNHGFTVEFRGSYVISCCPEEYFEDLKYELLELTGEEVEVKEIKKKDVDCYVVDYKYVEELRL